MPFWNQMGPLDWRRAGYPTRASRGRTSVRADPFTGYRIPRACSRLCVTGKPYPLKGYIMVQGNPLSWAENTKHVRERIAHVPGSARVPWTTTCRLPAQIADLVLPSTHWTERDYLADEVCSEWVFGSAEGRRASLRAQERRMVLAHIRTPPATLSGGRGRRTRSCSTGSSSKRMRASLGTNSRRQWIHRVPHDALRASTRQNGFGTPTGTGRAELYFTVICLVSRIEALPRRPANRRRACYSAPELADGVSAHGCHWASLSQSTTIRRIAASRICVRSCPSPRWCSIPPLPRSWASSEANGCGLNRRQAASP